MKKLFLLIVLVLSVSVVAAQAQKSSCCKKGAKGKTAACCKKGAADASMQTGTTDMDKANTLCPTVAAGEKCDNPDLCPYSHDASLLKTDTAQNDDSQSRHWWKFWGDKSDKDCCKKP